MKKEAEKKTAESGYDLFLNRFDKSHFFQYIEGYVLGSLSKSGKFEPGKVEWFIVDYFERHVFMGAEFCYIPEFAEAIFELLHRHQDKLVSFVTTKSRLKNAMFSEHAQRQYATLLNPKFNESSRGLMRSILDIEVMHRRRMNKFSNRAKRKLRKMGLLKK